MTRPVRIAAVVTVLAVAQVAAVLVYRAVERSRAPRTAAPSFEGERLRGTEAAPPLDTARADGTPFSVTWPADRVRLVHFWATWCEPCLTELPGLLVLARELRVELVAVAVDDEWDDIRRFFAGEVPPEVVVARDPAIHKRFGVSTLPDTYVVDDRGRLVERFHGARDWRTPAAREYVSSLLE